MHDLAYAGRGRRGKEHSAASPAAASVPDDEADAYRPDRLRQDQPRDVPARPRRSPYGCRFPACACSTTYESTLNSPEIVSTRARPPSTTVNQKASLQEPGQHPGHPEHRPALPSAPAMSGSIVISRLASVWRPCSRDRRAHARSNDVFGIAALVGTYMTACSSGAMRNPATSSTIPTTVNVCESRRGSSDCRASAPEFGSSRRTWPIASVFGHRVRAASRGHDGDGQIRCPLLRQEGPSPYDGDVEHAEELWRDQFAHHRPLVPLVVPQGPAGRRRSRRATSRQQLPPMVHRSPPGRSRCVPARWRSGRRRCRRSAGPGPRWPRQTYFAGTPPRRSAAAPRHSLAGRSGRSALVPAARPGSPRPGSSSPSLYALPEAPA